MPAGFTRWGNGPRQYALGRLPPGAMNKTEEAYSTHLQGLVIAGEIQWFKFEALKLRLADNTFCSPDLLVMTAARELEVHEVKGFWEDDARVKIKVAASLFPMLRFIAAKKAKGG